MEALSHICRFSFPDFIRFGGNFTNSSIYDVMTDMAPPMDDVVASCMWNYQARFCKEYFAPIFTEEGLCFAFNSLNSNEIYTEE